MANSYNPNIVAPPEMKLLELSIWEDGYTMPCVCYYDAEHDRYELVDGYHRYMVLKTSKRIYAREQGLLPVAVIDKELSNRIASTIRHNRARGTHNLELMSEIVAELTKASMSDRWIMRHIGMDGDELLRLKQITGLAELFAAEPFSPGGADDSEAAETVEERPATAHRSPARATSRSTHCPTNTKKSRCGGRSCSPSTTYAKSRRTARNNGAFSRRRCSHEHARRGGTTRRTNRSIRLFFSYVKRSKQSSATGPRR